MYKALSNLKKNKRTLDKFFEEARDILIQLPEHQHKIADQVIDRLDSITRQESVGAHVGEAPYVLEQVLQSIKSASRENGPVKKQRDNAKEDRLRNAEPSQESLRYPVKQADNEEKKEMVLSGLVDRLNRSMNLSAGPSQGYVQQLQARNGPRVNYSPITTKGRYTRGLGSI